MNVLLLGSGGREHALAWKIARSRKLGRLFIAPGNAGTALAGTNVPMAVGDFERIVHFVRENEIAMVVVGPEAPLVEGIADFIRNYPLTRDVMVIGPGATGAQLEGSKVFAKEFMRRHGIPTAASQMFDRNSIEDALRFIEASQPPYVLKADGLAAGKGVVICQSRKEAREELEAMLVNEKFGKASHRVLIEEFLQGIELSAFIITDGKSYRILPEAKDYKRIGDGDTGPNTGGMGSISPVPFADEAFKKKVENRIIRPTIAGLIQEDIPFTGFLFFGLMNTHNEPCLIEYNVRMGDPEAEAIMPRIQSDLLDLLVATARGRLDETTVEIDPRVCATIMIASEGYPGHYDKGRPIQHTGEVSGSILFHAGTSPGIRPGEFITGGGRVIAVSTLADSLEKALEISYRNTRIISFEGMYFRTDIGKDLLNEGDK
ncbi:MAG: phosphoribosylamine--glycine ligase [Bacteroidales bacterium]|nr:phosphoribosylamine--glycine ligase [Lentimicrobiaceae bacterium]MDD5694713.1 phosphoribosylamine--glycine ligase [Bacteroidales bacterium]